MYSDAEVERLREVMRLKELLGVSLEELKTLLAAEEARANVRAQLRREDVAPPRRRELLDEALGHIDRQLELVDHRAAELAKLESRAVRDAQARPAQDPRAGRWPKRGFAPKARVSRLRCRGHVPSPDPRRWLSR